MLIERPEKVNIPICGKVIVQTHPFQKIILDSGRTQLIKGNVIKFSQNTNSSSE